jgi:ABC-type dipeptide/oligopeptide/nickel transport systems, permease components
MGSSLFVTLLIGIPLGVISAKHQGKLLDQAINVAVVIGVSIFVPLLAFLLLYSFSFRLMWTPIGGAYSPGIDSSQMFGSVVSHMILPCATLVITYLASTVLYMRNSMLDVLKEDYVRTAKAKGVNDRKGHLEPRLEKRADPHSYGDGSHDRKDGGRELCSPRRCSPGPAWAR